MHGGALVVLIAPALGHTAAIPSLSLGLKDSQRGVGIVFATAQRVFASSAAALRV